MLVFRVTVLPLRVTLTLRFTLTFLLIDPFLFANGK